MKQKAFLIATSALVFGCLPLPASPAGYKFQHHFMDRQLPGNSWAQTALADVDKDGRLDYITGQTRGPIFWYRQEAPNRWVRHMLGTNSPSDVGGAALDVDGDGWVDFIAGGAWYRNTGRPLTEPFERIVFDRDLAAVHDLVAADVDRDGRTDVLTMSDKNNLRWYRIARDPRQPWERHNIGPGVHAGIGVGDLDGDGDLDVSRSNLWFENADGKGARWVAHENIPFGNPKPPYPLGTHCVALDLDRDGDTDLVMTENEIKAGRIGWLENLDGRGGGWKLHELPQGDTAARGAYHSLAVADFDNDGDPDVFSCEMEGIPGDMPPRWFIWENGDGKGGQFTEHVILDANLGGHLVVAGDVDADGDLDLIGKLWRPRKDNANEGHNHVDLLENRLVTTSLQPLRVSDNRRFLVTASAQPFFWLGDTSWHMFGKSARAETTNQPPVSLYFSNRAAKGFTVIQSVIVRWPEGGSSANAYGFEPFENEDWSRPRVRPGANDDYWDHVDWCVAEAKRNRLYLAALPCWLVAIEDNNSMVRDPRVAYRYGHFLGTRYGKEPHLIWVLGGDAYQKGRNVDTPSRLAFVRAQAEGIADAVNGVDQFDGQADWKTTLMTFHPPGGNHSSSEWLHIEPWLDFNMIQTTTRFTFENWRTVAKDYALQPPKPTLDAEVAYESSLSLRLTEPQDRRIRPWDVRRAAYWNVFAGGLGHTYGHRSFIGWIRQGETYRYGAHIPWFQSLDAPGAVQMGHLRRLMESRPFLSRIPDPSLVAGEVLMADEHLQATRDADGTYAMVYSPSGRSFKVRMDKIAGPKVKAWWFNPRTGEAHGVGEFANTGERQFTPPGSDEDNDWVLVLDDASKDFPPPGQAKAALGQSAELEMEKRLVCGLDSAAEWSPAESSLSASTRRAPTGQPVLHWHISVDHFGGEAKYPIGWPRISRTLREPLSRDWSGWDYLQLWVYTDTSREALPREPVGLTLHTPDKESAYHRPLPELKKGAWVQIRIPLADVPRVQEVRLMQFHISDATYHHRDELDLHFAEIALLRYTQPTLLGFSPECAVIFADANEVPVRFQVAGIKPGESAKVTCELRQGGKTVAQTTVSAARGPQRATLNLRGAHVAAGSCELRAGIARGAPTATAPMRLVASPWQEKEP